MSNEKNSPTSSSLADCWYCATLRSPSGGFTDSVIAGINGWTRHGRGVGSSDGASAGKYIQTSVGVACSGVGGATTKGEVCYVFNR